MLSTRSSGILLVICSTVIESFGQLSLKNSATAEDGKNKKYFWLAAGIACFAIEAVVWTSVLRLLEVGIAYPMGSLSFVVITLLSWSILKEHIVRERWLGVSLIICGTALLGLG